MAADTMQELAAELNTTYEELIQQLPCYMNHCDGHFTIRHNRLTGSVFFGCTRWPNCTATRQYRETSDELGAHFLSVVPDDHLDGGRWDR